MIWCQLKLTSRTNYLRRKASDDCLNWQGCQGVFFYSNANLEMFLPPNCRPMQKISHGTDKIWQRRGAARQHCAHKPLTSADPSGDFIPKMVQICALPKRRRIEASPKFRDTSQNIKAVEWQHVRCACNQKSAVFQDNRGRISSCLKGPSWQSWDLKTPLSGLRLRRSPKVGWVQQSSAGKWQCNGGFTCNWLVPIWPAASPHGSRCSGWHQPNSSHFCWPVLLHLRHR